MTHKTPQKQITHLYFTMKLSEKLEVDQMYYVSILTLFLKPSTSATTTNNTSFPSQGRGGTASMLWNQVRPPAGSTCSARRAPTASCRPGASRVGLREAGRSSRGGRTGRSTSSGLGSSTRCIHTHMQVCKTHCRLTRPRVRRHSWQMLVPRSAHGSK